MMLQPMKPAKIDLKKASHVDKLHEMYQSPLYVAEPKIDGCHYFCDSGRFLSTRVSKTTGNLVDKTGNFPHLVEAFLRAELGRIVLDGEIYYPGASNSYDATKITGCLENEAIRRQENELGWISYCMFDVLRDEEGNWLISEPWYVRREYLELIAHRLRTYSEYFHLIPVVRSRKENFLDKMLDEGREGIVLKQIQGVYIPGKRPMWNWMKVKTELEDDVVIMGFDPPEKRYTGKDYENWPYWEEGEPVTKTYYHGLIGSVVFGKYNGEGELVYLGSCTGIDDRMRKEFTENQEEYIGRVMKIKAMEKTADGRYRHPNFLMVHEDKNAFECTIEET